MCYRGLEVGMSTLPPLDSAVQETEREEDVTRGDPGWLVTRVGLQMTALFVSSLNTTRNKGREDESS